MASSERRPPILRTVLLGTILVGGSLSAVASAQSAKPESRVPGREVTQKDHPGADAVVLRREQVFTLEGDGTVRRREHRFVKLLSSRAFGRYGDPRIDFEDGREEVVIHRAVSHLPDGTVLPVPEYSLNIAAPNDVAGWPEYAAWRQRIVSFSGLEPGVVLEIDYEVVSKPGVHPWLAADIRLDGRDPVLETRVTVVVPEGVPVVHRLGGPAAREYFEDTAGGAKTLTWRLRDLPGDPGEPQAPPWQARASRLCFSTCPGAAAFAHAILGPAESAARPDAALVELAARIAGKEPDPLEQVRKITSYVKERFNLVGSPKTWRSLSCRPPAETLRTCYGSPLEAAALCAALLRALRLEPDLIVVANADAWIPEVPGPAALAGVALKLRIEGRTVHVHPLDGPLPCPGPFGPKVLLDSKGPEEVSCSRFPVPGEQALTRTIVTGKLTLDPAGKLSGRVKMSFSHAFHDLAKLKSDSGRKSFLEGVAKKLLVGAQVDDVRSEVCSEERFVATVALKIPKPARSHAHQHVLELGADPLFLQRFPLPLARSERRTPVRLAGRFREDVDLVIELPEGWSASAGRPIEVAGDWGVIRQTVTSRDGTLRIRRQVELATDTLSPAVFIGIRTAINGLRAAATRFIVVGP